MGRTSLLEDFGRRLFTVRLGADVDLQGADVDLQGWAWLEIPQQLNIHHSQAPLSGHVTTSNRTLDLSAVDPDVQQDVSFRDPTCVLLDPPPLSSKKFTEILDEEEWLERD